jgi:signal transduction histidine kinase
MNFPHPADIQTAPANSGATAWDGSDLGALIRWVDPVLGKPATSVKLLLPDEGGHFQVAYQQGLEVVGGKRSTRRRQSFASESPQVVNVSRAPGTAVAVLPLVCRGSVIGVLEVAGTEEVLTQRLAALEAAARNTALLINALGRDRVARTNTDRAEEVIGLIQELLAASSPARAVGSVVRFAWNRWEVPAVGWLREKESHRYKVVASRGIRGETRAKLHLGLDTVAVDSMIVGGLTDDRAQVIATADRRSVVLVKDEGIDPHLVRTVEAGLGLALDRLDVRMSMSELAGSMDAGLAWTAHELRGPLLGIEKAIDSIGGEGRGDVDRDARVIARVQGELRRLTDMVDDILAWSVRGASIRRRPTDLSQLVKEAIQAWSTSPEDSRRLSVDASAGALIDGDPQLLRIAIENLIRNSIHHTRDDVQIVVRATALDASVSVFDSGPGIPSDERTVIFSPFVQGRSATRSGSGLGLFIAQRVAQTHGGDLSLEATPSGSVFRLRFPRKAS